MDRNTTIGFALIAVILIAYIYLAPSPVQPPAEQPTISTVDTVKTKIQTPAAAAAVDSALVRQYGTLGTYLTGEEKFTKLKNEDLSVTFSNHGVLQSVELNQFKTYYQKPLLLAQGNNNQFALTTQVNGQPIDLYKLVYQESQSSEGDTTLLSYTATLGDQSWIRHTYKLPRSGYQIGYQLELKGVAVGDRLSYAWRDLVPLQEKQLSESRIRTNANWYSVADGFDNINDASLDYEAEQVAGPIQWASFRQKFFVSALIGSKPFSKGEFSTNVNAADTSYVKDVRMTLSIPSNDVVSNSANFRYYFGPNDYSILHTVAPSFERNVYLGWIPVKWVNQFVILPVFHLLEKVFSNYGVIIMILVLIIRLALTPLSYSSYLGMAKMRLLKPELDLIKEKNGDNVTQAQQDQMKLYQEAGVNPFAGCIPLLLQMPILLSMFYFFPASIEFRQEQFLWAEDLSTYDSILSLPFSIPGYGDHVSLFVLLMTISTLISTWQNNQISSVQGPMKSVSYIMPVIFLFILNSFSAGLSFYYFISNVFGFAQQAVIRRFVDEDKIKRVMDDHKKKMATTGGSGKKSSFMSRLQEAAKASEEARRRSAKK